MKKLSIYCVIKVNEELSVYQVIKVNEGLSVYWVIKVNEELSVYQVNKVNEGISVYQVKKVINGFSFYLVTQYSLSYQWLPSSKLLRMISMDCASTLTKCMMMQCIAVDAECQKVTEWVCGTYIFYYLADSVMFYSLVFGRPCSCKYWNGIYVMYCEICNIRWDMYVYECDCAK